MFEVTIPVRNGGTEVTGQKKYLGSGSSPELRNGGDFMMSGPEYSHSLTELQ